MYNNVDKVLNFVGAKIQITPSKYKKLLEHYNTLCDFIKSKHILSDDKGVIYQQGSFAIDTAIKPLKGEEFDVDMVTQFGTNWYPGIQVSSFFDALRNIFDSDMYKDKIEEYRNNIRINYQGDYHFDIMPVLPYAPAIKNFVKAPDKKRRKWVDRSPKAYADWFREKSKLISTRGYFFDVSDGIFRSRLLEDMKVEPLSQPDLYINKPVLNRVVQLVKRARDKFFYEFDDDIPQSVVITTLIAKLYIGQTSIYDFIREVSLEFRSLARKNKIFELKNPANEKENFTDKWKEKPAYYENFKLFAYWFEYTSRNISSDNIKVLEKGVKYTFDVNILQHLEKESYLQSYNSFLASKERSKFSREEIIEDKFNLNLSESVSINCRVTQDGYRTKLLKDMGFLKKNKRLEFFIENTTVKGSYQIYWKVRNVGEWAENRNQIRGSIFKGDSTGVLKENSSFIGPHFVECYIIKYDVVIATDRISVEIQDV